MTPHIFIKEYILAFAVSALLLFFGTVNWLVTTSLSDVEVNGQHHLFDPYIEVFIEGQVAKPGMYRVLRGASVGDLLSLAEPLEDARLEKLKKTTVLTAGRKIVVKKKKTPSRKAPKKKTTELTGVSESNYFPL